jgi:hypothetical protein
MINLAKRLILVGFTTSLIMVGSFLVSQFAVVANAQSFFGVLAPQSSEVTLGISKTSFTTLETAQAIAGGGSGDGTYSFTSTTPATCTISSSGLISPVAIGSCSIFATRASSGTFLQRSSNISTLQITSTAAETTTATTFNGTQPINRSLLVDKPRFDANISKSGAKSLLNWSASKRVSIIIKSKNGTSTTSAVALVEKGGSFELPALTPGYLSTVTVINEDESDRREFTVATPPVKPTKISVTQASKATNYAYIVKWEPASYSEFYQIIVTPNGGEKMSYLSTTPDFYLFDRKEQSYLFTVSALGEGGSTSDPSSFRATLSAPNSFSAKFVINPKNSKFTTKALTALQTVGTKSSQGATVTISTYYDGKVKVSKKLAKDRALLASSVIKQARPNLIVKISVTKATTSVQKSEMRVLSKAPARRLVLTNA